MSDGVCRCRLEVDHKMKIEALVAFQGPLGIRSPQQFPSLWLEVCGLCGNVLSRGQTACISQRASGRTRVTVPLSCRKRR
jgi:hypothetical protein